MKNLIYLLISVLFFSCAKNEEVTKEKPSVLIIGNSITYSVENPSRGWMLNCGMAATSPENDFCGILGAYLETEVDRQNIAFWERDFSYNLVSQVTTKRYDYLIVKVGENVDRNKPEYKEAFRRMINSFKQEGTKVIIVSTVWNEYDFDVNGNSYWIESSKDRVMREVAEEEGYEFADISGMKNKSEMFAWSEYSDSEIASHPNDLGMSFIAQKIIEKVK